MSAEQGRRFICKFQDSNLLEFARTLLEKDVNVSFLQWSDSDLYIELSSKRQVSYFVKRYSCLSSVHQCIMPSISSSEVRGVYGSPMETKQIRQKGLSTPEKLGAVFQHVREKREKPDLSEDISAIINKGDYDKVISAAKRINLAEDFKLKGPFLPWQKMVLTLLGEQTDRQVLWVFDFDGRSGKTELSKYLRYKMGFQRLSTGSTHNVAGTVDDEAKGYFIDFSRTSSSVYETFELLEDLKDRGLDSSKYAGVSKILNSHTLVLFANFLPNLATLSIDRWQFFHTRLGVVYFDCRESGSGFSKEYQCWLSKADENTCDVTDPKLKCSSMKNDTQLISEYLDLITLQTSLYRALCDNSIAFPKVTNNNRKIIRSLLRKESLHEIQQYIIENSAMLVNSILPMTYLKSTLVNDMSLSESEVIAINSDPYINPIQATCSSESEMDSSQASCSQN